MSYARYSIALLMVLGASTTSCSSTGSDDSQAVAITGRVVTSTEDGRVGVPGAVVALGNRTHTTSREDGRFTIDDTHVLDNLRQIVFVAHKAEDGSVRRFRKEVFPSTADESLDLGRFESLPDSTPVEVTLDIRVTNLAAQATPELLVTLASVSESGETTPLYRGERMGAGPMTFSSVNPGLYRATVEATDYQWRTTQEVTVPEVRAPHLEIVTLDAQDTTAPSILNVVPINGLNDFNPDQSLYIVFDEAISVDSITADSITLSRLVEGEGREPVSIRKASRRNGYVIEVTPEEYLRRETDYELLVSTRISDNAGNRIGEEEAIFFQTRDNLPPVFVTEPPAEVTAVEGEAMTRVVINADDGDGDSVRYDIKLVGSDRLPDGFDFDYAQGHIDWTPSYDAAVGSTQDYIFRVSASDGCQPSVESDDQVESAGETLGPAGLDCFDTVSATMIVHVEDKNQRPLWNSTPSDFPNLDFYSEDLVEITVQATDPDGDPLYVRVEGLPDSYNLGETPMTDGSWTLSWQPQPQDGDQQFDAQFILSDHREEDGDPPIILTLPLNIQTLNHAPRLTDPGSATTSEGQLFTLQLECTDADEDLVTYSYTPSLSSDGGADSAFIDADGLFQWQVEHSFVQGSDSLQSVINFKCSDGILSHQRSLDITVYNVNRAPVVNAAPPIGQENTPYSFALSVSDLDEGDDYTCSMDSAPVGASFNPTTLNLSWLPSFEEAGEYEATFTCTDGSDPQTVTFPFTINNTNRAPQLGAIEFLGTTQETERITAQLSCSDADDNPVSFSMTSTPAVDGATLNAETGFFEWTPSYDQSGPYEIIFTCTDADLVSAAADHKATLLTIANLNRSPILSAEGDWTHSVAERSTLSVPLTCSDADGESVTLSYGNLPSGASVSTSGSTGELTWTPEYGQEGAYTIAFSCNDGHPDDIVEELMTINVAHTNQAPVLSGLDDTALVEGEEFSQTLTVTDPDGEDVICSLTEHPSGLVYDDLTRTLTWVPSYDINSGTFTVTVTCTDGIEATAQSASLVVSNTNRRPVAASLPASAVIHEGETLQLTMNCTDPDAGSDITYSMQDDLGGLGASLNETTGIFSWTPTANVVSTEEGSVSYTLAFNCSDGTLALENNVTVEVEVLNVNRAPTISLPTDLIGEEASIVSFALSVADDDGDQVTCTMLSSPTGATFDASTLSVSWSTDYSDAGSYGFTFQCSDGNAAGSVDATLEYTIVDINHAPVINSVSLTDLDGQLERVSEGGILSGPVDCTDPNGDDITYGFAIERIDTSVAVSDLDVQIDPETGIFQFSPTFDEAGSYRITFSCTEQRSGALPATLEIIEIIVDNFNRSPIFSGFGLYDSDGLTEYRTDHSSSEGSLISLKFICEDPDDDAVETLEWSSLPDGATIGVCNTEDYSGSGRCIELQWTPAYDQANATPYAIDWTCSDGSEIDAVVETVTITVFESNQPPTIVGLEQTLEATEGQSFTKTLIIDDPDSATAPTCSLDGANIVGASWNDVTRLLSWTPDYTKATTSSCLTFSLSCDDDEGDRTTTTGCFDVANVNRAPSISLSVSPNEAGIYEVFENNAQNIVITCTDEDTEDTSHTRSFECANAAACDGATIEANSTFRWTPNFDISTSTPGFVDIALTFYCDDGQSTSNTASTTAAFRVYNTNRAPSASLVAINDLRAEGQPVILSLADGSTSDPDGDVLTCALSAVGTSLDIDASSFDPDSLEFVWTPNYTHAGNHAVSIECCDRSDGDAVQLCATATANLSISDTNRVPTLANKLDSEGNPVPVVFQENSGTTYIPLLADYLTADDPDEEDKAILTYSLGPLPSGAEEASVSGSVLIWDPSPENGLIGSYVFEVCVNDDEGLQACANLPVTVENTNQAPTLSSIGTTALDGSPLELTTTVGETLSFVVTASDPDNDVLSLEITNHTADELSSLGVTFTGGPNPSQATLSWTPSDSQIGSQEFLIRATETATASPLSSSEQLVRIVVIPFDNPPTFDHIGAQTVAEKDTLNFSLTRNDTDTDAVECLMERVSPETGEVLTDETMEDLGANLTAACEFSWTPGYNTVAGAAQKNFDVWFIMRDVADSSEAGVTVLESRELVRMTVTDTNQPPTVVLEQETYSVSEGQTVVVRASCTDLDGRDDIESCTVTGAPAEGATVTQSDIDNGYLLTMSWVPGYDSSGSYNESSNPITFQVTDGESSDATTPSITVGNVNQAPAFPAVANLSVISVVEESTLAISLEPIDPDYPSGPPLGTADISCTLLTDSLSWITIEAGCILKLSPGIDDEGDYDNVLISGQDSDGGVGTVSVNLKVIQNNRAPVFAHHDPASASEGGILEYVVSATDPDNDTLTYTFEPSDLEGATISNRDDGSALFRWTPTYAQAGTYTLRFSATDDGSPADDSQPPLTVSTEPITFTISNTNRAPEIDEWVVPAVAEADTLSFTTNATDPDNDTITLSCTDSPLCSHFNTETGLFEWTPTYGDAGSHGPISFSATDGSLVDTYAVTIVVTNTNQAPVFPEFGIVEGRETEALSFSLDAVDPDTDETDSLQYALVGFTPLNPDLVPGSIPSINETTGLVTWTPGIGDGGNYVLVVTVRDINGSITSENISVSIQNVNQSPEVAPVTTALTSLVENNPVTLNLFSDPDGDELTCWSTGAPSWMSISASESTCIVTAIAPYTISTIAEPSVTLSDITFFASDGTTQVSTVLSSTITNVNRAPYYEVYQNSISTTASVDVITTIDICANDDDNDALSYSFSGSVPISGATITGCTFSWAPTESDRGKTYSLSTVVTDGEDSASFYIQLAVDNIAPVLAEFTPQIIAEQEPLAITLDVSDPENDSIQCSISTDSPGGNARITPIGFTNGSITFSWTPSTVDGGEGSRSYEPTICCQNAHNTSTDLGRCQQLMIQVTDVNRSPIFDENSISLIEVTETESVNFTLTAIDPDLDAPALTLAIPTGAPLTADISTGDNGFTFSWDTTYGDAGEYDIAFIAEDQHGAQAVQMVTVRVNPNEVAPVIVAINDQTIAEGQTLTIPIDVTDPNGDGINFPAESQTHSANARVDLLGETPRFIWDVGMDEGDLNPTVHLVQLTACDTGSLCSEVSFHVNVTNTNQAPTFTNDPGPQQIGEAETLTFQLVATDADPVHGPSALTIGAIGLPSGASFEELAGTEGIHQFTWTPAINQGLGSSSPYEVTFTPSDGIDSGEPLVISIIVFDDFEHEDKLFSVSHDEAQVTGFNIDGDTLWTYVTPTRASSAELNIAIDDDAEPEVIITTRALGEEPARLICLEDDASDKFTVVLGATESDNPFATNTDYSITEVQMMNLDDDDRSEIITVAAHIDGLAYQLSTIDEGELEGSYWHPGPITTVVVDELDADEAGRELLIGGSNLHIPVVDALDVERVPVLASLASNDLSGQASPRLGSGSAAKELYYVVLDTAPSHTLPISCIEIDDTAESTRVLSYVREDCLGSSYCVEQNSGALCNDD